MVARLWQGPRPSAAFFLREGVLRGLAESLLGLKPALRFEPGELTIVPPDLRTVDPIAGRDIVHGRFVFAGREVTCRSQSPFAIVPPSHGWFEELHGFDWLRHLRALATAESQAKARILFQQWHADRHNRATWQAGIAARRLIAWLSHAPVLLKGAPDDFYDQFVHMLAVHVRHLHRMRHALPQDHPRLQVEVAKAFAMLCLSGLESRERAFSRHLSQALAAQINDDGVHVSRNPRLNCELLADLLPLRQSYAARQIAPPQELVTAIDRLMPMLRFFRLGDGRLARFHGTGAVPGDLLATLLAYDETKGQPVSAATTSGYDRLEAGASIILVDSGASPPRPVSRQAHASCTAFEMTSGNAPLVINCGAGPTDRPEWRFESRQTRNHSTLSVENASSCSFLHTPFSRSPAGPVIRHGARVLARERVRVEAGERLHVEHNGYERSFGLRHARTLLLAPDGLRLEGRDALSGRIGRRHPFRIHFHLHPSARARTLETEPAIVIQAANGERWVFVADHPMRLADSLHFANWLGPRPARQIMVEAAWPESREVYWRFERLG